MNKLIIASTFKTPSIHFDDETGVLAISGRVFPENPSAFFEPIIAWINAYLKSPSKQSILILSLSYFNSSANEYLFRCCKYMEANSNSGNDSKIVWQYESDDDDMKQMGEDFKELLKINFEIKAIN